MTEIINLAPGELITAPGLYAMPEAAYHADPCETPSLSRSIAEKLILQSPMHAFAAHPRLTKQEEKDEANSRARDIGSAAHAMLLGQPTVISVLMFDDFKKKAAQEARTEAQEKGAIALLKKDMDTVQAMVEKARAVLAENEDYAIRALAGEGDEDLARFNEVTAVWQDRCGDIWSRARMDRLSISAKTITIIDYKTTELSAAPDYVARTIFNNNYHFQEAFYRRGLRQLFPEIDRHERRLEFRFIVQEQEPPFEITVAKVDAAGRLIGEKMASAAFLLWRKCLSENHWPGYPGETKTAEMPAYIDTRWCAKEIEDPYLQGLGIDPLPFAEANPYKPKEIMSPC